MKNNKPFWVPRATTNYKQERKIKEFINGLDTGAVIVDAGSSSRRLNKSVINLDLFPKPNVDIAGDIHNLPLKDNSVDAIIITGVLEHVADPMLAVKEIHRILKVGGLCYASVPFMQGYHPDPTDYQRYTIDGIQNLFKDFEKIEVSNTRGSGSTMAWLLPEFFSILLCFNNDFVRKVLIVIFRWLFLPIKYFDFFLKNNKFDKRITSGFTFIGKKGGLKNVEET